MAATLTREQISWRWRILVSTYLGYAGYYLCRKVYGLVKTSLHEQFNWEMDAIAYVWAAYLFAYMIGQFVNGFVGRKWGPRVLLLGGLGMSILCNLVFASSSSYSVFMSFMILNGFMQATGWPGSVGAVSHWIRPHERGFLMGGWGTSYIFGNIITKTVGSSLLQPTLAPTLAATTLLGFSLASVEQWRLAFFACSMLTVVIWLLLFVWQRNKPEDAGLPPIVDVRADEAGRAIRASNEEHVTMRDYLRLAGDPLIVAMGLGYFFIKFLRYALDSWLPTFLENQGLSKAAAGYWSMGFDIGGILPCLLIGWALDRYFRGDWARLCFISAVGLIGGYIAVITFEANPIAAAICFGIVGFMVYGPDTLLAGAASVAVAGERNGVAVAGLVNGLGSIGPIVQELVIGKILSNYEKTEAIHYTNLLALGMSVVFAIMMLVTMWRVRAAHAGNRAADAAEAAAK
ncbi:MAG: MFS transporter [Candidatus Hydrogenedentes bacterium]|nr:MFS transporter [Candidatus Hydrogenedentota bacterium]